MKSELRKQLALAVGDVLDDRGRSLLAGLLGLDGRPATRAAHRARILGMSVTQLLRAEDEALAGLRAAGASGGSAKTRRVMRSLADEVQPARAGAEERAHELVRSTASGAAARERAAGLLYLVGLPLSRARLSAAPDRRPRRSFESLLADGVVWPAQNALALDVPPRMPRMIATREVRREILFESRKMRRPVECESKTERAFYAGLDRLPGILWYQEQPLCVRYTCNGKRRTYYPDAVVALTTGRCFVVEVKPPIGMVSFETICKIDALGAVADDSGYGIFLGNHFTITADFLTAPIERNLRSTVLKACAGTGMTSAEWTAIRKHFGVPAKTLNSIVLSERLVVCKPFLVRHGDSAEGDVIDRFVHRFERVAPVLPMPAPAAPGVADKIADDVAGNVGDA